MIQIESQASKKIELDCAHQNNIFPKEFQIGENDIDQLKISSISDFKSDHYLDKNKLSTSGVKIYDKNNQDIIYEDPVYEETENKDQVIQNHENNIDYFMNKKKSLPRISEEINIQNENNSQINNYKSSYNSKQPSILNEHINNSQNKTSYPSITESHNLKVINTSNIDITESQEPLKIQKLKHSLSINEYSDVPNITLYEGKMNIFYLNELNKQKPITINHSFTKNTNKHLSKSSKNTSSINDFIENTQNEKQIHISDLNDKKENIPNTNKVSIPLEKSNSNKNLSENIKKESLNYQNSNNQSNIKIRIRSDSLQTQKVYEFDKSLQSNLSNKNKIHESINLSQSNPYAKYNSNTNSRFSINSNQRKSKITTHDKDQSMKTRYSIKNSENSKHVVNFRRKVNESDVTHRHSSSSIQKIYSTEPLQPRISSRRISYKKSLNNSKEFVRKKESSSNIKPNRITLINRSMTPSKAEPIYSSSSSRQIQISSNLNTQPNNLKNNFDEYGSLNPRKPVLVEDNGEYKRYQFVSRSRSRVRYVDQDSELKSTLKPLNFSDKKQEYNYLKNSYGPENFNKKLTSLRKSHKNVTVVRGNKEFLKAVYYRD